MKPKHNTSKLSALNSVLQSFFGSFRYKESLNNEIFSDLDISLGNLYFEGPLQGKINIQNDLKKLGRDFDSAITDAKIHFSI